MPEFFNVLPPQQALDLLLEHLPKTLPEAGEVVSTRDALGRVTIVPVHSAEQLPSFPRSAMDGFSVRAADTFGATEGLPAYFNTVGEVPMGMPPSVSVGVGEAAVAHTGGMLARGADAVVMVENTQPVDEETIEVVRPVAPGENVVQPGEDLEEGDLLLPAGHLLRPQDLGGLMAAGVTTVRVSRRPTVGILSMGDEVVPPDTPPGEGQVRDVNTYTISALVEQAGGIALPLGIARDDYAAILSAARLGLEASDVLVLSAGSSVSIRDFTAQVVQALGEPGVLVHGIALRPGKPAIVGLVGGKAVFGLPGNPVSAMVVFELLVRPTVQFLLGCVGPPERPVIQARLAQDIPSVPGREDYVPVRLGRGEPCTAEPVFGKSNLIFTMVRADGVLRVPLDRSGLYAGEDVPVTLFST